MKALLALIKKLYGSKAIQNAIGTRTNVITLPDKDTKRFLTNELNIEAASDAAVKKAYNDAEKLIPELSKLNDQEILTLTGNLRRIDNRLNPPSAEVIEFGTKQPVSPTGIKQLAAERGLPEGVDPDSLMGRLLQSANKVKMQAKEIEEMTKPGSASDIFEAMTKNPYRPGGPLDPAIGITRTAARSLLEKKGIKIENKDPLDLVRENFGQDVLGDLNNLSEELLEIERRGGSYKDIDKILDNEGFFDLKINKNAPKGLSDEEFSNLLKQEEKRVAKDEDAIVNIIDPEELTEAEKIITDMNKMDPMDAMYEANKVLKKEGKYKNLSDDDINRIMKGTEDNIFERNIPEDEFAEGGRVGMASGGIAALKTLIRFLGKQSGKTGSQNLADINPKRLGFLENMLMKSDKEMLKGNRIEYLEQLSDIVKSDRRLLNQIKEMPEETREAFYKSVNEGGNKGRLDVYKDINIDDAILDIEQMIKNLKFKDVPEDAIKRQMNAGGGVAYLMGL